jgi:alpha-mannosidase
MSQSKTHNKYFINDFCTKLKDGVYSKISNLSVEAWVTKEPTRFNEKTSGEYKKLQIGISWGELWDCSWMHFTGKVPLEAKDKKVVLIVDVSGEGCVVDIDGNPIRGITTYASTFDSSLGMPVKRVINYLENSQGDENIDMWIETGCNDLFGNLIDSGCLKQADISVCNEELRQLYYDYKFLIMLAESLEENSTIRNQIEHTLFDVAAKTTQIDTYTITIAREKLAYHLNMKNADESLLISAIGHAHIDLAWLWPIRETKRKGARTFSTAIEMIDRYPDYIFGASQPQLYQWMKEDYPVLYDNIKKKVSSGRWECQGAMWVEPDTNVSGGESLVRQVLYGKKFFKQEFNEDMKILWLPDVFGYSGALPQILKKSDVPYFMTIKLSWNEHNTFPHNTLIWKGIDGSEILVHMPPENTYNSGAMPSSLKLAEKNFKDKDVSNEAMLLFGIGDGGGGPSTDHIEYLNREKNIAGLPPTTQEHSLKFFDRINKHRNDYKKWSGELYLEKHQGTYTTQAKNKKYNRLMEFTLRDCEYICSIAKIKAGFVYPQAELEEIWKEVLLYQFHDILPGSSIKRVYDESIARYKIIYARVQEITQQASETIAAQLNVKKNQTLVFNTLSWERTAFVTIDNSLKEVTVGAYGSTIIDNNSTCLIESNVIIQKNLLENEKIKVEFNNDATIKSIYDKEADREVLNKDYSVNNLVVYEDTGDCWDIPFTYLDKAPEQPKVTSCEIINCSPNIMLRFIYSYGKSTIQQDIHIEEGSKKLVFDVHVDWNETNRMLRAQYPIDISTNEAACNIQFGHIMRPTHKNTSWDYAKIEVCAQKWIDLSEKGYGVSLINNCKYGHKVWDNILDINLLRSPMHPGVDSDKGEQDFSYELFIHDGDLLKVTKESYNFNTSFIITNGQNEVGDTKKENCFIYVSHPNVVVEAVKLAEDGNGIIVRLYECNGQRTHSKIKFNGATYAELTNLIEQKEYELDMTDQMVELNFKPFEINTIKFSEFNNKI